MTLNYNNEVMTSRPWTLFRLLFCWKSSIWKAVASELLIWLLMYGSISLLYHLALSREQKQSFSSIVVYLAKRLDFVPLDLVLGFFVQQNFERWNYRYRRIGFIDNIGLMVAEYVRGYCERSRRFRRTILRYCELGQCARIYTSTVYVVVVVLAFRDISLRARRRFPTLETVVAAGFMSSNELKDLEQLQSGGSHGVHLVPYNWALALTYDARREGIIESDYYQQVVSDEIKEFRSNIQECVNYDWTPLPMLYSQVVCLSVHMYFLVATVARQFSAHPPTEADLADGDINVQFYFPVMTVIQFVLYIGWLKVGETILNPFGEDDDDWETNALIDRNITMGLMIVDGGFGRTPEQRRDPFWDEKDMTMLYSEESAGDTNNHDVMLGSASQVCVPSAGVIRMVGSRPGSLKRVDVQVDKADVFMSTETLNFAELRDRIGRGIHRRRRDSEPPVGRESNGRGVEGGECATISAGLRRSTITVPVLSRLDEQPTRKTSAASTLTRETAMTDPDGLMISLDSADETISEPSSPILMKRFSRAYSNP